MRKCRIGTAKFFTLLLLLYRTSVNAAGTSFQAELCPVINTVTPRAFYWIFAVWNYYDYWKNYTTENRTINDFENNYLKRNDYYFVLANLLTDNSDRDNLVGKDNCAIDLKDNAGPYPFNRKYFVSRFGGMQYYNPGCTTLGFITDVDNDGKPLDFPKITEKLGVPMAQAFESAIKDTEYYKNYRLNTMPVPREVLEELGKNMGLSMENMEECKRLLRQALFEPTNNILFENSKLIQSKDYLLFINQLFNHEQLNSTQMRQVLYDSFYPGGKLEKELPEELKEIAKNWEVVIGRQYFTLSIELIWKYMLLELTAPMDRMTWIRTCLNDANWTIDKNASVKSVCNKANYSFDEREKMVNAGARSSKDVSLNLESALKVMLSICNRFANREDIRPELLNIGGRISIFKLLERISAQKEETVSELLAFIMDEWVIKRHEEIAYRKLMDGRDGFFFEKIDDKYYKKVDSYPDFTGNRMMQLMHVMKDLDMME